MHWWHDIRVKLTLAGVGLLCLGGPVMAQDAPIRNLRIPLEHYADGRVKTQITAETARLGADGNIQAEGVKVELFDDSGTVTGTVNADACFVDRAKGLVTSTAPVRFEQQGVTISGVGFEWKVESQSVTILDQARVVFERDAGRALGSRN